MSASSYNRLASNEVTNLQHADQILQHQDATGQGGVHIMEA